MENPAPTPPASAFEKLGLFYLGRLYDRASGTPTPQPLLYDSRDLTTHAVCVGMTGSGKTGLCLSLLEEAALDGIPAIAIDPKGDVGNLLLTFPELRPEDFRPWIDEAEAARKGRTPEEHAAAVAEMWKEGLAEWGEDGDRIRRFREAVDIGLYTPGSTAGVPLRVLQSFAAPAPALRGRADALRERVSAAVSGLLALLGIEADPIRSREHILLATLLDRAWGEGRDLELGQLIRQIQEPPVERIGVVDIESFYPADDRTELAMSLNGLLASPGFAPWMEGEPLDIQRLLWTEEGKPRISIVSIAHLGEAERMFFVTLLLGELVAWMRTQPGTSSLRALLYMDEVFGYFPPVANPPSKEPMLTLLKQARAFGLGVVLATQNPVDLDYKGLSNAGTWFLGRLQTERDKLRVLEGLEGAAGAAGSGFDRGEMDEILAGLRSRVFLLHNVHEDAPALFHTRWAMSYLRGPLTRAEIRRLSAGEAHAAARPATAAAAAGTQPVSPAAGGDAAAAAMPSATAAPTRPDTDAADTRDADTREVGAVRPLLPPEIHEVFLAAPGAAAAGTAAAGAAAGPPLYSPALLATARLHFVRRKGEDVHVWRTISLLAPLSDAVEDPGHDIWQGATVLSDGGPSPSADGPSLPADGPSPSAEGPSLSAEPAPGARFADLPGPAARPDSYEAWEDALEDHLYREHTLRMWTCEALDLLSEAGESEGDFRVRVSQAARERRDRELEELRGDYADNFERARDQILRAEERVERERSQYADRKRQSFISIGAAVLGMFTGRRSVGRATTAARSFSRAAGQKDDIGRALEEVEEERKDLEELEAELERKLDDLREELDPTTILIEPIEVRPRKSDITVERLALAWVP